MSTPSLPVTIKFTSLTEEQFKVTNFRLEHPLSRPYEAQVSLLCSNKSLDFSKIVAQPAEVTISLPTNTNRYLNGYVAKFVQTGAVVDEQAVYVATVVPWIWFLSRRSDSRIFQNMTYPEVVKQVFTDAGFSANCDSSNLTGHYEKRPMTVQYNETDFDFVSRLMEQEGFYYYFEQEKNEPTLYLCDSTAAYQSFPNYSSVIFNGQKDYLHGKEHLYQWTYDQQLETDQFSLDDHNYLQPKTDLTATEATASTAQYKQYRYPGWYQTKDGGSMAATARFQEHDDRAILHEGLGNVMGLPTGYKFSITGYPRQDQNGKDCLITRSLLLISGTDASSGAAGYTCELSLQAIPAEKNFRPAQVTSKPLIEGCQTALVWAPPGSDTKTPYCSSNSSSQTSSPACNTLGNVNLQFYWDRNAKANPSTCPTPPIRVAQYSAGSGMGAVFYPLPGTEVVVSFEQGDPDRPIVTGRVYNGDQAPPITLPGSSLISTIQDQAGNYIQMDATSGKESITLKSPGGGGSKFVVGTGGQSAKSKGIWQWSPGNWDEWIGGIKSTQIVGLNFNLYIGGYSSNTFGLNLGIVLGGKMDIIGPYKMQIVKGQELKYNSGLKVETYSDNCIKIIAGSETKVEMKGQKKLQANLMRISFGSKKYLTADSGEFLTLVQSDKAATESKLTTSIRNEIIAAQKESKIGGSSTEDVVGNKTIRAAKGISLSTMGDLQVEAAKGVSIEALKVVINGVLVKLG